jgi:hypothetical protein
MKHDDISHLKCRVNSKYNSSSHFNESEDIIDKLMKYYYTKTLFEFEYCMIPTNIYQQREMIYRKNRELKLYNIKFVYHNVEQCYYDFSPRVNDKKIQEKVCGKGKKSYTVSLYRRINKYLYKPYQNGMNDTRSYWFNIDKTDIFYIIPKNVLLEQNKIEDNVIFHSWSQRPMICIYIDNDNIWYSKYNSRSDYSSINLDIISNIFV